MKDKLGCAEKSIQSSIRRIGKLEKAVAPTLIEAEKFKKQVQDFQDWIKKFSADAERMRTMFHNGLKYDGKNDEPCDMFPENNGGIHPLHVFPKNRREEMIEHLVTSRVSDVTNQHPEVLRLKKELEKEKLEKQTYKDALAEKEYQAFEKDRRKAESGSGSSTHRILWLMVDEYKKAVLDFVDKKRIYKKVFWGLERFNNFRSKMYKEFGKSMFPKERSMEGY